MNAKSQKVAIVTGGSKGIGRAIAERLSAAGLAIVVNYAHDDKAAEAVADSIRSGGGQAVAVRADLGQPTAAAELFDAAERAFGAVDVLVNNAGAMTLGGVAEFDDAAFERLVTTNLGGPFRMMREGARRLRPGGRIINLSSTVVGLYQPRYGAYAATKAGVEALTHVLAKELGARGVTVNAVAPGPVETELFLNGKSPDEVRAIVAMNPQGRLGRPEDIAEVVSFLASPEGGWVSGQVIRANGGVI
jgi:3-oxoacyl-[acyl-carrier protein] reductase